MASIEGFTEERVVLDEVTLSVHRAGAGKPLVLLHGYPQNHMCWAQVAPEFAKRFQVIVPDFRGYGTSDAPPDDADHTVYSKRRMAQDVVELLDRLGIAQCALLCHDRGARVGYRLALDHPQRVSRIGIIEVVPTLDFWEAWDADLALKAYHWTFLAQPAPLPESLINAAPEAYVRETLARWTLDGTLNAFRPDALDSYLAQARDPARVAAMCADYRAGATTDQRLDAEDRAAGRRITAPLHFLWARSGFPAQTGDPAAIWRRWADRVTDASCDCGHFAMEEAPSAVLDAFLPFFTARC